MTLKKRILSLIISLSLLVSITAVPAYASNFNPVVDTITSSTDSRITSLLSDISLQSFSSTNATRVTEYLSYFIYDSTYAAIGGSAWPYTNERGYVSTVTDGTYTISGINGSGCFAYSKYVMNVVYGTTGEVLKEGEDPGSITASGLETFLRTYAQAGEQLRLGNIHSITFISCTDYGFYYMDYWSGYIRLHYTTYSKFANSCNSSTSSVELWLYNAETATNDITRQSSTTSDGTESSLSISPTDYPSGQHIVGSYYTLRGTVISNYTITSVTGTIYSEDGTAVQTRSATPDSNSFSFYNSEIDNLRFGSLSVGGYYLEYTATDSSGRSVVWTSDIFYVVNSVSTLTINPVDYPTGTLAAQAYTLTGTVSSNYTLTSVSAYIYNTNGDTLYAAMVTSINSTSFTIANSGIDNSLPFGSLEEGSYYLVYEASDASGNSASWTSEVFTISASGSSTSTSSSTSSSSSSISINPTDYPTGNISAAAYTLKGSITSTTSLSSVTAQILGADGTVIQSATASDINSNGFSLQGSSIDSELSFAELSSGYYYLVYTARDSSGNSSTWSSAVFAVGDKSLYSDLNKTSLWYYWQAYALSQKGVFDGISSGGSLYFYPDQNLTRAQAVCLFYRLYSLCFGTPEVSGSHPFTDVKSGCWYDTELTWAYTVGLVNGISATSFDPDRSITREEMAKLIYYYAQLFYAAEDTENTPLSNYTDGDEVSSWAAPSVNWCINQGIFTSTSTSSLTFQPQSTATRGQAAVRFYNILKLLG